MAVPAQEREDYVPTNAAHSATQPPGGERFESPLQGHCEEARATPFKIPRGMLEPYSLAARCGELHSCRVAVLNGEYVRRSTATKRSRGAGRRIGHFRLFQRSPCFDKRYAHAFESLADFGDIADRGYALAVLETGNGCDAQP
jgi:hypothetical protein